MDNSVTATGGIRIGWFNASWPFARLQVTAQLLTISCGIFGSYAFKPDEVVGIEPYGSIPVISNGIRIVHTNATFPETIIFWCMGSRKRLIQKITDLGFEPRGARSAMPSRDGIAFRWSFVVLLIVAWNALFILDGFVPWNQPKGPGPGVLAALALFCLTSLGLIYSSPVQALALKPGRSAGEVGPLVRFLLIMSSIGFVVCAMQYFVSA